MSNTIEKFPQKIEKKHVNREKYIFGISINVLLMGFVSLFSDLGGEMITAIMPYFVFTIAGANWIMVIGLIEGLTNALANIIKGISGWLSDKIKSRKSFVILGYGISNIAKPIMGFQDFWGSVLALKVIDRIGKGIRVAPRDSLISYYSEKSVIDSKDPDLLSKSGLNFGIHRTMDNLGGVLGSLLAALLLFLSFTYKQIIFISIIPGIIAIIFMLFVKDVKEDDILALKEIKMVKIGLSSTLVKKSTRSSEKIPHHIKKLVLILSFMEFASIDMAFIMVRAKDLIDTNYIIILFSVFFIMTVLFSTPAGKLCDKYGKQKVVKNGLCILFVISLILSLPIENLFWGGKILIILIFPFFGIYQAILETGSRSFVSDITGKNKKGKIYGLYYFLVGVLSIFESVIFATLYQNFGYIVAFPFSTIILFFCILIFARTDFTGKNIEQKSIPVEVQLLKGERREKK